MRSARRPLNAELPEFRQRAVELARVREKPAALIATERQV